jgi:hypothetical protein
MRTALATVQTNRFLPGQHVKFSHGPFRPLKLGAVERAFRVGPFLEALPALRQYPGDVVGCDVDFLGLHSARAVSQPANRFRVRRLKGPLIAA